MSTPAQLAANRANAQLSTGPRTPSGKSRSSKNALTHGLYAQGAVLPTEDPAEYQTLRVGLLSSLAPQTSLELHLAGTLVLLAWKLRRLHQTEALLIRQEQGRINEEFGDEYLASLPIPHSTPVLALGAILGDYDKDLIFERIQRHQVRLQNQFNRILRDLLHLKKSPPALPDLPFLDPADSFIPTPYLINIPPYPQQDLPHEQSPEPADNQNPQNEPNSPPPSNDQAPITSDQLPPNPSPLIPPSMPHCLNASMPLPPLTHQSPITASFSTLPPNKGTDM